MDEAIATTRPGSSRVRRAPSVALSWTALYVAITLDVAQVFALDQSDGFQRPVIAIAAVLGFFLELYLFTVALRRVNAAVAYGLFGVGAVAVAVISIAFLDEHLTIVKALALLAVISGAILLNGEGTKNSAKATHSKGT